MAESVYKIIELVGTSTESWEKAAVAAVNKAGKTLRDLRVAEVGRLDLQLKDGKVVAEEPLLSDMHARIRDVRVGPDGAVYVLTDSGTASMSPRTPSTSKLLKLTPK